MKIKQKFFITIFLPIFIIGIIAITTARYVSKNIIKKQVNRHLLTTVQSRAQHIKTVLAEYSNLTKMMATGNAFVDVLNPSKNRYKSLKFLKKRIDNAIKSHETISMIRMLDKNGIVITSSHADAEKDMSNTEIFLKGKEAPFIGPLHISQFIKNKVISAAAPILLNKKFVGLLIIDFNTEIQLFKITTDHTGLGKTGEVYLVNVDSLMISPSRFKKNVFLKQKIKSEQFKLCKEYHFKKNHPGNHLEKPTIYSGYLDINVLGHHYFIEETQWCMLAEIQEEEAFKLVDNITNMLFLIFLILFILAIFMSYYLSQMVTKPILKLHNGAEKIMTGSQDFHFGLKRDDELGDLANTFDKMTSNLQASRLELEDKIIESEQQQKATINIYTDLETINVELQKEITERGQAQEALRENEEKLRILVEGTPSYFFYTQDTEVKVTYISPSVETITGHKVEDWIGQKHWIVSDSEINRLAIERSKANLMGKTEEGAISRSASSFALFNV